jgi:antitoxin ParD1/3/4
MSIVRKSITFTEQLNQWVQSLIAQGDYANESEYVRDLIRHDRDKRAGRLAVQEAIQAGIDSGVSDQTLPQIMKEVEERMKADGRL